MKLGLTRKVSLMFSGLALVLIGAGFFALEIDPRMTRTSEISCLIVGGMVHAVSQFDGKYWGPDLEGQVDTGMSTGNSLAAIERLLWKTK